MRVCVVSSLLLMYAKGTRGLRNLDETLAALRQNARQEARLTQEELRRYVIREDIRRQNAERRFQQQGELLNGARPGNVTSGSVGCESDAALPGWYDGQFAPPDAEDMNSDAAIHHGDAGDIVEDVTERVSRAAHTLYPQLLNEIDACAVDLWPRQHDCVDGDEDEEGMQVFSGDCVVEWSGNRSPLLLRCTRPSSTGYLPLVPSSTGKEMLPRGRSGNTSKVTESKPPVVCFDGDMCSRLYEYDGGADPLKSALLSAKRMCEGRGVVSGNSLSETKGPLAPQRPTKRCWDPRAANKPVLHSVGTAVAESSAKSIAKKIRQSVKQQPHGTDDKGSQDVSERIFVEPRSFVTEPKGEEVIYVQVAQPLMAHFCDGCGACAARDVTTGLPDSCTSCGETFGPVAPMRRYISSDDDGEEYSMNRTAARGRSGSSEVKADVGVGGLEADGVPPDVSRAKSHTAATMETEVQRPCSVGGSAVATQAGARNGPKPLPLTAKGLYFLYLWDQAVSRS